MLIELYSSEMSLKVAPKITVCFSISLRSVRVVFPFSFLKTTRTNLVSLFLLTIKLTSSPGLNFPICSCNSGTSLTSIFSTFKITSLTLIPASTAAPPSVKSLTITPLVSGSFKSFIIS